MEMNITLPPELEKFILEKIKSGMFKSPIDVIHAGLIRLEDELDETEIEWLRREVAIGIKQADEGKLSPLNVAEIKRLGRKRLAALRGKSNAKKNSSYRRGKKRSI